MEHKANRLEICQDLLRRLKIEPNFLDKVITGDESCVWLRSRDQMAKCRMAHKTLLIQRKHTWADPGWKQCLLFFFNSRGIVHKGFVTPRQTVNHAFYKDVLERLQKRVQQVRRDIGCCTMIMRLLTLRFRFKNFWWRKTFLYFHILPTAQINLCAISTSSLSWNRSWRVIISGRWKTHKNCNRWATHTYGKWLPVLLWAVEKTLEPLCDFPRVTPWRR